MKLIESRLHSASFNAMWLQYALVIAVAITSAQLHCQPCTPTKTSTPGETVWVIADRIQGIVGGATSPAIVADSRVISQDEIPFVITESGRYILCEDLTAQPGAPYAIWIQASDVTLDLNKHAIFKQSQSSADEKDIILLTTEGTVSNIIIQNGRLVQTSGPDTGGATLNGIRGISIQNALLKNIEIYGSSPTAFDTNGIKLLNSQAVTVSDIKTDSVSNGFLFDSTSNLVLRDCDAINSQSLGFTVIDSNPGSKAHVLRRCRSVQSVGQAFAIQEVSDVFLDECVAINSESQGFNIQGLSTSHIYLKRCCALSNGQQGFLLGAGGSTNNCGFFECVSSNNGLDGFALLSASGTTFHSIYRCTAARNNTSSSGSAYGFNVNSGSSFNVYNNLGYQNNNGDFNGVPGTAVFSSATALGPAFMGPMTGLIGIPPTFVTNDFWPNLST